MRQHLLKDSAVLDHFGPAKKVPIESGFLDVFSVKHSVKDQTSGAT